MDFEKFKDKVKTADNDGLLRSLIDYAKTMDTDLASYDAVKIVKEELLKRLEGEEIESVEWREELTEDELTTVIDLYEQGLSVSKIQKELGDNSLAQKPIRLALATRYGQPKDCAKCGKQTLHLAFAKHDNLACINCGNIN